MSLKFIIILICYCFNLNSARIHHLSLHDDSREQVTISTFGFLKGGLMQMQAKLDFNPLIKTETISHAFAFIIEKTNNNGFSSFSSDNNKQNYCNTINSKTSAKYSTVSFNTNFNFENNPNNHQKHSYSLVAFELDIASKKAEIKRIGKDLRELNIEPKFTDNHGFGSFLSNEIIFPNETQSSENDLDFNQVLPEINFNTTNSSLTFKFQVKIKTLNEEGLYILSFFNCFQPENTNFQTEDLNLKTKKYDPMDQAASDLQQMTTTSLRSIFDVNTVFKYGINLELDLLERNEDSFLSAGELPVPALYLTWSIIYFLAGVSWMYILKASKGDVFKIHYLMMALVFIKSISLTFHAINMHYIAVNGRHEAIWAILYYITYVLRGLLLIISILLVGTGWTFIKHILTENERRLFVIVVPMQILAVTAYIFLEEKEEGDAVYVTWRQLFFLLDLLCCGAILFPVVWSIRHLEKACASDGKMVTSLKKLKIFKHFYIMVIFYIYFTRIIGFLLKQMLPFRYEWLDELSMEVVTFTFFAFTAFKFQPASNNPYLQLNQEETEDLINSNAEMIHLSDDFNLNSIETDTVFDIADLDLDGKQLGESLQPCGPDTANPNLFSRNKLNN